MTLPADLTTFIADLRGPLGSDLSRGHPASVARAPGRLDVLGGIADYSGSLCLELPLREAACAVVQRRSDGKLIVYSPGDEHRSARVELPADCLRSVAALRTATESETWARYLAGPLCLLHRDHHVDWSAGATIIIRSAVPEGAGVSSSAAIEVAVLVAALHLSNVTLDPRSTALLAQQVENIIVGAPCGVMDQCTVACGSADALLRLLCQPCELQGHVHLPTDVCVWGINSGQRHAVGGGDYGSVRAACAMGTRILAELRGASISSIGPGRVRIEGAPWGAHIVNCDPATFNPSEVPDTMTGAEFIAAYHGIADPIAAIDPSRRYSIRAATAHPIFEHQRVVAAATDVCQDSDAALQRVGQAMFASHASYGACGLGASGPDRLVALAREAMENGAPLFGAKITGGGSGGTVAILGRAGGATAVQNIAAAYADETGTGGYVFSGSSLGACELGGHTISC